MSDTNSLISIAGASEGVVRGAPRASEIKNTVNQEKPEPANELQSSASSKPDPIEEISRIEQVEGRSLEIASATFSIERVRDMVRELEAALPKASNSLSFRVDDVLNRPVITVFDKNSGEVVRTLPSDEVVRVMHNIDKMRGILFEDQS